MAVVWTSYQGIEVVESQSEVPARHPRWGYDPTRMAPLKGASLLMLADETLLVVCDEPGCNYNGLTGYDRYVTPEGEYKPIVNQADSLLAHINGKHHPNKPNRRTMLYTDDQVKVAIKVWLKWRATKLKNWTMVAGGELERMGFKPYRGEHWTSGQLGGLVRNYMKKDQFKNLKAAPMDEEDQAAIAEMVRESQAYNGSGRRTSVAANVRVTQKKPAHKHTPIDFAAIIDKKDAAPVEQQEDEPVVTGNSPTLSFAGHGGADQIPTRPLVVGGIELSAVTPAPTPAPVPATRVSHHKPSVPVVPPPPSDYEHLAVLPTGEPLFKYQGKLMVGKPVKGVDF